MPSKAVAELSPAERKDPIARARARAQQKAVNALDLRIARTEAMKVAVVPSMDSPEALMVLDAGVMDLVACGCDPSTIARRLTLTLADVQASIARGMRSLQASALTSAETVRAQADMELARIRARLNAIAEDPETDTTSKVRALEVQARVIQQRTNLYAAQVRETDADLAEEVAQLLASAANMDRSGIGLDQPADVIQKPEPR